MIDTQMCATEMPFTGIEVKNNEDMKMLAMKIGRRNSSDNCYRVLWPKLKPLSGTYNRSSVNLTPRDNVSRQ